MRGPLIGGKDFETSIGQGKQAQGKVIEACQRRKNILCGKKRKGRE